VGKVWVLKTSQSLCDMFVCRTDSNTEFMEDFSVLLLSKLLQTSIKLCSDSDKTRYNAVRAIGNLLRYLPPQSLGIGCVCSNYGI